ncbi:glycoside hydrolase family 25 protein [Undibacterium pigrum]|uniref:Lysozyme n=1 Tax=Undibacterium pigrum TaxID=401470 RepID=A0A318IWE9_9BURK|nr:GH25 family lysozyme [Undibacterium pigrum]PXX39799.1 lysozyme [Undibacterium pigrum]
MASNSIVHGIDVSHYQGTVNWYEVAAAGTGFAFAKATEGTSYQDPQFANNWFGMQAAGILRGAYHFYQGSDDPVAQANDFIHTVGTLSDYDLPPVIDLETLGGASSAALIAGVQTWLDTVEQALGRTPMIYTDTSFWDEYMNNQFSRYPLWIAEYGVSQPRLPNGWASWTFWQNSQSGTVTGVNGQVDTDVFAGSLADLQAFAARR